MISISSIIRKLVGPQYIFYKTCPKYHYITFLLLLVHMLILT